MGVIKNIGGKSYSKDANGDWYELESPVQKEPITAKVLNGKQYYKDNAGNWYEGGTVAEKKNGLQPSSAPLQNTSPQSNEPVDIISMGGKPIFEEPQDVVSLALKAKTLSNKKISATTGGAGAMMGSTEATYEAPDVEANKEGEKIKSDLKKMGFDADKLASDFDGIPDYVFESFPKEQLLSDYTNNPEKYSRTIGAIKGQIKMGEAIDNEFKNQNIDEAQHDADKHDFVNSINLINNAQSTAERTRHIRRVMEMVDRYGGDNKEDIKRNLLTDFAYVYGKMAGEEDFIMSNAGSNLNNNQAAALEYIKDVHPEQLRIYAPAFVNKDLVKDNYEAQLAQEESLKRLDELGIQLSRSYLKEKLAPIKKEYDQLSYEAQTDGMTPELQQRLVQLEQEGAPVYNKLQMLDADQQNLSANYPKAAFYEANTFAQELIGQKHGFFNHALSKVGEASKNTVEGVWDFATSPLKSNEEEQLRQAEVVGEGIKGRSATYVTDISGKPVLSPELKAEVEKIKNDNNLSYDQKLKAITQLLMQKNGEWYKEPESNVNLKSLAYGITDLAAGLVPFMGLEMLTGGGATAGMVRKFTSTFVSAAATSFEDAYRSGIEKGVQNPYAYATRVTAINSAAIAGAGTPDKIRAMFAKSKSAIGDLVAKMSDKEIEATLKEMPKSLKGFKVSLDAAKSKLVSSGKAVASSFGDAAKINTMMTAGNIANDAISGELRSPADYTKDFLVETLKFGLLSTGTKAATKLIRPTDMGMVAMYEAATNKDGMILHVDEKVKQGDISPTEGEQLKKNIEDVSKIYKKNTTVIGILFDKQKREYLYNALTQERSKQIAESLPEKEGEKYEIDSEAAKFRNGLLVEPKTESQLEKRKEQLEKSLVPEKDESGKNIEIPRKEVIAAKAEMKAIDDVLAEYAKAKESNVTIEPPLEKSGVTEIGEDAEIKKAKEAAITVEKPMQPIEVTTIGEEADVNIEKAKDLINSGVVKGYTAEVLKDVANNDPVQFQQYLKEIADQAQDPLSEKTTIDTYGKELVDVAKEMFPKEIKNEITQEPINPTEPILTKEEPKAEGVVTEVSEGAEVSKEKVAEFEKMTTSIPNGGEVKKYLSGDTIKKYEEGAELRNNQEIIAQELEPALRHGVETIEKAKEVFGDNYVPKTLEYIKSTSINPENKALLYVSLENEMAKRVAAEPDNLGLKKLQDLVRTESQAYLRSNSLAINMGRLRKFAEVGYDITKLTDQFFSNKEMEAKATVEKLVQADANTIQKEYESTFEEKVQEAAEKLRAEERKAERAVKKEKIHKAIDDAMAKLAKKLSIDAKDINKKGFGDIEKVLKSVGATMKAAYDAGESVAKVVKDAIDYISEKLGTEEWNKDEFIKESEKALGGIQHEKTMLERIRAAEFNLQKRINSIKEEILAKERDAMANKIELQSKKLQQLKEQKKSLEALRDKYLPKEKDKYESEKAKKEAEIRLSKEIQDLNRQINKGEKDVAVDNKSAKDEMIELLKSERDARVEILEAIDPSPKIYTENALIKKGFGKKINVKTKNGVVEKVVLDWKKLAGEEGSISNISKHVGEVLRDGGYTNEQAERMSSSFINQYNDLRASVIQKGLNEIAARNKKQVAPEQKSAAKRLAEMYNYGLFDKNLADYEIALAKTIGIDKLNEKRVEQVKAIGDAMAKLYTTEVNGKRLTESQMRSAIQVIEHEMRVILHDEAQQHGGMFLKVADIARTYMDLAQRMTLNSAKQALENPFSGRLEKFYSTLGYGGAQTKEMAVLNRKLARDLYKEMVLQKGLGYGNVSTTFVNRGNVEMQLNKMSDSQVFHGLMSTVIGKTTLDAVDSFYKSKITQQKFTYNLIQVLTKDRLINGEVKKGMSKEEAKRYVAEKLTGQSYKDAQKTAKEIIDKVNKEAGKKLFNDSQLFVDRLANDIVNAALVNGEKITEEMVEASYNAAYKAAGRGLGHVANNFISEQVGTISGKIENKINEAIKNKEYNKAAILTLESIFFRNIANPFVGGGTNWVVLKVEKSGLGLLSGLGSMMRRGEKMDLTTETGVKNLEKAMYENLKIKDKFIRGSVGLAVTGLTALVMGGVMNTDEYRKWRNKNRWAAKYLDTITPEVLLASMAEKDKSVDRYLKSSFNQNDQYDKSKMLIKGITELSKGHKDKAAGQFGQLGGSVFGAPTPWRLIRDGQQIWVGATGGQPYRVDNTSPKTWWQGFFKGGMIDYMGFAPKP